MSKTQTAQEAENASMESVNGKDDNSARKEGETTANDKKGVYVHTFKEPFEYEGTTYEKITFDFAGLKGTDMIKIEDEMAASQKYAIVPEISSEYLILLAEKASGVSKAVLEAVPLYDFAKIRNAARDFLTGSGL
jgi:hypothetical protein